MALHARGAKGWAALAAGIACLAAVAPCAAQPARLVLEALPPAAKAAPASPGGPLQVGVARPVAAGDAERLAARIDWTPRAGGGWAGRFSVASLGARAARVALRDLPEGATVVFRSPDGLFADARDAAEVASLQRRHGVIWGPVVEGEEQSVEILSPRLPRAGEARVEAVSHLHASASSGFQPAGAKAAGSCNLDAACAANSTPALDAARRSVAKLVYTVDGATYACTGTLVRDGPAHGDKAYVLTAKHCIGSEEAAGTLNSFWFLQAPQCGEAPPPGAVQLTRGARLAFAGAVSDVALLELHERAPQGAAPTRLAADAPGREEAVTALHHPRGDPLKVSSGIVVDPGDGASGKSIAVAWLAGTTEPGSSGSGLFVLRGSEYVLQGTLRGGSASCSNSGAIADPANRDLYSRIDTEAKSLQAQMAPPPRGPGDLWEAADAPGRGLSVTQHASGNIFAAWFAYDARGEPTWLSLPGGAWLDARTFTGTLFRTRRAAGAAGTAAAGQATVVFDGDSARLELTVDGVQESVALKRTSF